MKLQTSEHSSKFIKNIWKTHVWRNVTIFWECIFEISLWVLEGFSNLQCLLAMLEKWKRSVDNSKIFGALFADLSKAFECLHHELVIVKLKAYGFCLTAWKVVHNHLSNRKQWIKTNSSYRSLLEIIFGVRQASIPGPLLLFKIF